MAQEPNIWENIGGSFSFGQQAKPSAWIPYLVGLVAVVLVAQVTGIFKTKRRR